MATRLMERKGNPSIGFNDSPTCRFWSWCGGENRVGVRISGGKVLGMLIFPTRRVRPWTQRKQWARRIMMAPKLITDDIESIFFVEKQNDGKRRGKPNGYCARPA